MFKNWIKINCIILITGVFSLGLINQMCYANNQAKAQVLVRFKTMVDDKTIAQEAKRMSIQSTNYDDIKKSLLSSHQSRSIHINKQLNFELLSFSKDMSARELVKQLNASPLVEWAEPNYKYQLFSPIINGPNDPYYQSDQAIGSSSYHGSGLVRSWWVDQIKADQAFADNLVTATQDIIIAILDSGMRLTHEDLIDKLVTGYDFVNNDQDPTDDNGHGTHVAGIAAASANNNIGIPGIGYLDQIKLMPVKVTDDQGSAYLTDIIEGLQYAADNHAKVINMSFGGPEFSYALNNAVNYAYNKGCVLVAAAGNYGESTWDEYGINPIMYPASFDHVISVAATNSMNGRARYSEFNNFVDLAAPGGDVFSLNPSGPADPAGMIISTYSQHDSHYQAFFGTSMASPNVAGAAAILFANQPNATPDEIESQLISSADKIDSLVNDQDGYNEFLGWGQINLYQALKRLATYPASNDEKASYNYPNPFNPNLESATNILIPKSGAKAQLMIMNSFGHKVNEQTLTDNEVTAGLSFSWDGRDGSQTIVANGVYPYILKIDGTIYRNKIVVKR